MLKVALILGVVVAVAVLLGLLYVSFKMLRNVQIEEAKDAKLNPKQYQLHPKLQQELDKQKQKDSKSEQ
ncbi:hypothetical protein [Acinetobacter sp. YH12158]|uniref:hypothetical protein n=1 Tax=Acinetobacter TaxID=469 RepID=UPI0035A047C0